MCSWQRECTISISSHTRKALHETTITAARSYFPNWRDIASFLEIFNTWWTISNSKQRFAPNILRSAVTKGKKSWVFKSSGRLDWTNTSNCVCIDYYSSCPCCAYRRLTEAYQYVITARLQSDPVERRFSQCRRMNGGRFLVNLREFRNSERILICRSLLKENINFWEEDLTSENLECVTVTEDIEHGKSWKAF